MLDNYTINSATLMLLPYRKKYTKVVEVNNVYYVNKPVIKILKYSCRFFGVNYESRRQATKNLTNISSKSPILVEETRGIIFFPTKSPREDDCAWISFGNLISYDECGKKCMLKFNGNKKIVINISYYIIDNQVTRALKLEKAFNVTKKYV